MSPTTIPGEQARGRLCRTGSKTRVRGWLAAGLLAAGCAPSTQELVQAQIEQQAAREDTCRQAGFAPASDNFKLCLLIAEANQRLDRLERRVDQLELNGSLASPYPPYGYLNRW